MAPPVWVLSVDLQTKTATFASGMGEAAKSARSAFDDIRDSAREAGEGVRESTRGMGGHMMEARHGVMMLGEEFGVHLPRGITTFIASLGPVGAAMEEAFPFLAIILGATLLIEHLVKVSDAADKAAEDGRKMADGFTTGLIDAQLEVVKAETEIRKLAGEPAWDLLAQELQLKDAKKGYENISHLEGKVKELLEVAHASSNWNPFNWFDNSGDVANKVKALKAEMDGKSQSEQGGILAQELVAQTKILEQRRASSDASATELQNQAKYVDFLNEETALIQTQAYAASKGDEAQAKKGHADEAKKAEEAAKKRAEAEEKINKLIVTAHKAMNQELEQNDADVRKMEEFWLSSELSAEKKAADEKVRIAKEEYRQKEAAAKEAAEQGIKLDKMLAEVEKKHAEQELRLAEKRAAVVKHFADEAIFSNRSVAAVAEQMGKQMLQSLISNTLEGLMVRKSAAAAERLEDAGAWARGAGKAVAGIPIVGPILAPIAAAAGFAAAMAFEDGGIVPGVGRGDIVPAMLTPGEGVMPKPVMDGLKYQAEHGSPSGPKGDTHVHVNMTNHMQALDSAGMQRVLDKHGPMLEKHVNTIMRGRNL